MEPSIEKHAAMSRRKYKAIAIEPYRIGGIHLKVVPEKNGPEFSGP
jgi:hypothetical protein